jgi:CRISPR-associated protein Csm2
MARENLDGVQDLSQLSPEDINSISEHYGYKLADKREGIKTNQVRNIFSTVMALRTKLQTDKKWSDEIYNDLILIKPKLAYAAGRQKNVKPLYELLSKGVDATVNANDKEKALKNFIQLVESIVAYHKFYGGN